MSTSSSITPLKYDADTWIDLEVAGNLINNKWTDDEKRGAARNSVSRPAINMDAVKIVWEQVKGKSSRTKAKQSKSDTFDHIDSLDPEGLKCLYAAFEFTRGIKEKYISYYYDQLTVEPGYQDLYDDLNKQGRRVGKTLFLYLYDQDALKSIFSLSHIDRPKPKAIGKNASKIANPTGNIDIGKFEDVAKSTNREARKWCDFEYEGDEYITIKRHYRDAVDPQARTNEEVEQAEYVVTRFYDKFVDVYTEKNTTASSIREQLGSTFKSQSVQFDSAEERKPNTHFNNLSPFDAIQAIDKLSKHTVMGVKASDSGLSNGPRLTMRTEGQKILPAIRDIRNVNSGFVDDMRDVAQIVISKDGKTYTLFPRQADSYEWYVRYQAAGLTDDEREEFEQDMEKILDIQPFYVSSN
ncbi:hypothetical protein [Halobaculum litoreum]|uniref:Uncharacterized protein n=1 Tax=Halobaculum litoreum TaxID=3031998 RepID=A0ABD5XQ69_9EURY|nr:hypothetical protein [Halobaculum sp. DT92]